MYYGFGGFPFGYGYGYDPTYILIIIGAIISMMASANVRSTFSKYAGVRSASGLTGAQVAESMLRNAGIFDVRIERVSGSLTDHFDPRSRVVRLSDTTYDSPSVAAIGVAAHECGHVMQHSESYLPLILRNSIVPIANFGSRIGVPLIILGVILGMSQTFLQIGFICFAFAVLFHLVTLPVEINASRRAVNTLENSHIMGANEIRITKKVLGAAALTYVASATASLLQLLRLFLLFGNRGGRDRR